MSVLEKGLSFCLFKNIDWFQLELDLHSFFFRAIKLKIWFDKQSTEAGIVGPASSSELTLTDVQLHLKSDFTPVANHVAFDTFVNVDRLDLEALKMSGQDEMCVNRNMKLDETNALKELSNNPCLTIKPSGKGGAVVIIDTTDYVNEVYRQLNDQNVYRRLSGDPKFEFLKKIRKVLDSAREEGVIDDKLHSFLYVERPRTPVIYMLPKNSQVAFFPIRPPHSIGHWLTLFSNCYLFG